MLLSNGCQKSEHRVDAGKPRIAVAIPSQANELFGRMAASAKKHQAANPETYDLILNDGADLAAQVNLLELMILQEVNAIVIAPSDTKALVAILKRARQSGIVVVNIDCPLDAEMLVQSGLNAPFIGPDERAGARRVGEALAHRLNPGDKVAIIAGSSSEFRGQQRRLGFEDAVKAARLNIVSAQNGDWGMDKADRVAAAMLNEHPDLKAILCANDNMALGAVAAIRASGKTGKVLVAGFDNIGAIGPLLASGRVAATADWHADQLAVFGIESALKMLRGQAVPAEQLTPVDLVGAAE